VLGEKIVFGAGDDVDNGVADAEYVVTRSNHDDPKVTTAL
jgi:hypothetical protein